MAKLVPGKPTIMALGFVGGALFLAGPSRAQQNEAKRGDDFSHVVSLARTYSRAGDTITIDEVRGPSEKLVVGNTYEVKGTYTLASREKAMLGAFVTISSKQRDRHPEALPQQTVAVSKGEGRFTLRFRMWQKGEPHVSFYPAGGGDSFGGLYF